MSQGSIEDILEHFSKMEEDFVKNIERRILIYDYSEKLFKNASRIEFYDESNLVGLLAFYINKRESFITNCSIIPPYRKKKIGSRLMEKYEKLCKFWMPLEIDFRLVLVRYSDGKGMPVGIKIEAKIDVNFERRILEHCFFQEGKPGLL